MRKTVLFVLTISGLSALITNLRREYHHVKKLKTWAEAQNYCREVFTDLATVDNQNDNNRLQRVLQIPSNFPWIGLYDDMTLWKWVLGDADYEFHNWRSAEPDNVDSKESCTAMTTRGLWLDRPCWDKYCSVCYHEQGPSKYIFVETLKTWTQARNHCMSTYTGLVSVRNMSENINISRLVTSRAWIGLSRRRWAFWSDQSRRTFTNWNKGQPDNHGDTMTSCVVVKPATGKWFDVDCETKRYFVCQSVTYPPPRVQQKTTLEFQSEANLTDPAVQQQILEQLHAEMEKYGLSDFKLRWTKKDGQTFHKQEKRKKEEGSVC